jgi:hypothetical protein
MPLKKLMTALESGILPLIAYLPDDFHGIPVPNAAVFCAAEQPLKRPPVGSGAV